MRMLCGNCLESVAAKTHFHGSDRAELLGWCCGLLPGLLYCAWRQVNRHRICPRCGSADLMYETRSNRRQRKTTAPSKPASQSRLQKPLGYWPHTFATPRNRLRVGGFAIATCGLFLSLGMIALHTPGTAQQLRAKSQRAAKLIQAITSELFTAGQAESAPKENHAKSRACWSQCGASYAQSDVARIQTCVLACVHDRNPDTQVTRTDEACIASLDPSTCAKFVGNF